MTDFAKLRERMVERQIAARGIRDPAVLAAFRSVPRETFVAEDLAHSAYDDGPLPIEAGQTISQPYIVALMVEASQIQRGDRVLEIGAGSGYAAAIISRIAGHVTAIERHAELVGIARDRLRRLSYDNVDVLHGDGSVGCPERAPFHAILAAASGSHIPAALISQLAPGGRLVTPIGEPHGDQQLVKLTKRPDGTTVEQSLGGVRFVPLIGEEGWRDA